MSAAEAAKPAEAPPPKDLDRLEEDDEFEEFAEEGACARFSCHVRFGVVSRCSALCAAPDLSRACARLWH
jgi:hypothetical protein